MTRKRNQADRRTVTVAESIALATAWSERAAIFSTLAYQLPALFHPGYEGAEASFLVQRIGGGASMANRAIVEGIRAELLAVAEQARALAERELASTVASSVSDTVGLAGDTVALSSDASWIAIPSGGAEVVSNPRHVTDASPMDAPAREPRAKSAGVLFTESAPSMAEERTVESRSNRSSKRKSA